MGVLFALAAIAVLLVGVTSGLIWRDDRHRAGAGPPTPAPGGPPAAAPPADLHAPGGTADRIGIVLVHGIGEQRRFEHLSAHLRDLIRALETQRQLGTVKRMSVEITGSGAAALHAEQDTWTAGPGASVTIAVRHTLGGISRDAWIFVHEVWWADVNEPYSIAKQLRFWLWGLAVWAHPGRLRSGLPTAGDMAAPSGRDRPPLWDRYRLWMVGVFFVLLAYSIGTISFLATRLLNLRTPNTLRTLANYISAVKLYNQDRRWGASLLPEAEDFLDTTEEPPRVSIRRRMMRTIADVACNGYHRWYILAHSQGSVVAFNGLMETAYSWPGYLDRERWKRLKGRGMAGVGRPGLPIPTEATMPRRPAWAADNEIVYRSRLFRRFAGFLTYGSPLAKFAAIWPALVPLSREPAFHSEVAWINLYDALDPVSGRLLPFAGSPPSCCPTPRDVGYTASWLLLVAHLKYLTRRKRAGDAATAAIEWMLTGNAGSFGAPPSSLWFDWNDPAHTLRRVVAWLTWIITGLLLICLGSIVAPLLWHALAHSLDAIWSASVKLAPGKGAPP